MNHYQTITHPHKGGEHLLGIAIVLAFLLPHTNTLFQLVNPLLCLLLVWQFTNRRWSSLAFLPLVPIALSLFINMGNVGMKAIQSTIIIMLYFACFPFVSQVKVRNVYLHICLGYIFISQIVYLIGIPFLINFFDSTYPISEEDLRYYGHIQKTINYSNFLSYRLGGLFHNPNQCARSLTMLMAFYLVVNNEIKSRGKLLFLLVVYLGTLFTGSRTGFVIASLILYFGLFRNERQETGIKYLFGGLALLGVVYVVFTGAVLRGIDVESGMSNSVDSKWYTFLYYLKTESSIVALLFGNIDPELFSGQYGVVMNNFDSEYGELIFRFGFIGFACIMLFWWKAFKRVDKSSRFFFLLCLWIISSTIVASYRAFFIFMLLLSVVYANSSYQRGRSIRRLR